MEGTRFNGSYARFGCAVSVSLPQGCDAFRHGVVRAWFAVPGRRRRRKAPGAQGVICAKGVAWARGFGARLLRLAVPAVAGIPLVTEYVLARLRAVAGGFARICRCEGGGGREGLAVGEGVDEVANRQEGGIVGGGVPQDEGEVVEQ